MKNLITEKQEDLIFDYIENQINENEELSKHGTWISGDSYGNSLRVKFGSDNAIVDEKATDILENHFIELGLTPIRYRERGLEFKDDELLKAVEVISKI